MRILLSVVGVLVMSVLLVAQLDGPLEINFESGEGYVSDSLNGQHSWETSDPAIVVEVGPDTPSDQNVLLPGQTPLLTANLPIALADSVVFFGYESQFPVFEDDLSALDAVDFAFGVAWLREGDGARLHVLDLDESGASVWVSTGVLSPTEAGGTSEWHRITYRLDYTEQLWDLFVDGEPKAYNLAVSDGRSIFDKYPFSRASEPADASGFDLRWR